MPARLGILALVEFACIALSFYAGAYIRFLGNLSAATESIGALGPRALLYATLLMLAILSVGLYRTRQKITLSAVFLRLAIALVIGGLASAILYYALPLVSTGRGTLALALLITFPCLLFVRFAFYSVVDADRFKRNIIILGRGNAAASLTRLCETLERPSFRLLGFVEAPGDCSEQQCDPALSTAGSFLKLVRQKKVDEIVVAMDNRRECFPARELLECRLEGTRVTDTTTFLERETGKIDLNSVRTSWLIYGNGFRQGPIQKACKRAFDILASLVFVVITTPVLVLAVFGIFIESRGRGPIIYRQARIGLYGETFDIFKLRSMRTDAEHDGQARWAESRDPRVTSVGSIIRRLRIDELPQIINILRGQMSFVGPRPERPEFVDDLAKHVPFYRERHCVKPGLTGWAQLCYPYGASLTDARQKLQYDLYYVKNRTITFDILILLQTLEVVIWDQKRPSEEPGGEGRDSDVGREVA